MSSRNQFEGNISDRSPDEIREWAKAVVRSTPIRFIGRQPESRLEPLGVGQFLLKIDERPAIVIDTSKSLDSKFPQE